MANVTPLFDLSMMYGGYMGELLKELPKIFNKGPKPVNILAFVPTGNTVKHAYLSIKDAVLYLHNQPLDTPGYTPEVSLDLTTHSLTTLAAAMTDTDYTANVSTQDGTTAALLLGFKDFPLNGVDTIQLQMATSRLWKFLYPIAQAFKMTKDATTDAEHAVSLPFGSGFWLDFWGDWFGTPRLSGMTDVQYVAYLLWMQRVPKVNNMAIEDILSKRYQVPVQVKDSGSAQFTAYVGMYVPASSDEITSLLNKVKAAGVSFLIVYLAQYADDYKAYLFNRYGWTDLSGMATYAAQGTVHLEELKYGSYGTGFLLGTAQLNLTTLGGGSWLKDAYTMS